MTGNPYQGRCSICGVKFDARLKDVMERRMRSHIATHSAPLSAAPLSACQCWDLPRHWDDCPSGMGKR